MDQIGLPKEFVILDAEYTAWEGSLERNWNGDDEYREVVQIGAVAVRSDGETLTEEGALLLYVWPEKNRLLSSYFTQLTGIDQATLRMLGMPFALAMSRFTSWAKQRPLRCWGGDLAAINENAKLLGHDPPFSEYPDCDIRMIFRRHGVNPDEYESSTIPRAFNETPPAQPHNALNDARSILQGLRALARYTELEIVG